MTTDEDSRLLLRAVLLQRIGDEATARLMDALPPYNWTDLATQSNLRTEISSLRSDMTAEFTSVRSEFKGQIAELRVEMHSMMRTQLIQLTTIFGILNASMVAVMQLTR